MLPVGRKPGWVFDRDFEWDVLANFAGSPSPSARLGVVSGRHRQGKTFLLRALAETVGAFYYAAAETTAAESLRDLGGALAVHTGGALPYAIGDWGEAIRALRETFPDGLVIVDEFPYLIRSDPSLPSLMQRALDDRAWGGQERGTRFLLCGSAMSVMGGLLSGRAPLRGRAGLELMILPGVALCNLRDIHGAEFRAAHGTELRVLVKIIGQSFVMHAARGIGVERKFKLFVPVE